MPNKRSTSLVKQVRRTVYNAGASLGIFRKSAPFFWPVNTTGMVQWQMGNFLNWCEDGFALNAVIYASIMYKVRSITQAKARAYIGDPMRPDILPPTHPLTKLVHRPNKYMSWMEMQGLLEAYLNLSGNAYLVLDHQGGKNGIPGALWPIRPDEMYIIPDTNGLQGYMYVPRNATWASGTPMLVEDVIHIKLPNPMDMYEGLGYGLSPMSPLARSGDVDNSVTRFLKLFFDRGAMPAGLLKYDIPLDKDIVKEIKNRWREVYGGIDNWTDIGILDSGASYQQLQQSFKDMGFSDLDSRNEERMIMPFGVPPILIGSKYGLEHATYSNYEEARRAFWEDTMVYEIRLFETELQALIVGNDGSYIGYDMSSVPALRQNVTELVAAASQLFNMSVPADVALQTVGLHMAPLPYGQISYVPGAMREAGAPMTSAGTVVSQPTTTDGGSAAPSTVDGQPPKSAKALELLESARLRQEQKKKQAESMQNIMDDWVNPFSDKAAKCFKEDLEALLVIVNDVGRKALKVKTTIDWTEVVDPYEQYLKKAGADNWRETFTPMIGAVVNDAGKLWSGELGVQFNLRDVLGEQWFQDYTLKFAQPINDTTGGYIKDIIAQAKEEGWSVQTLQSNFQTVFKQWMKGDVSPEDLAWLKARLPDYRAEAIARTETNRSANGGSQALYKGWGVKKKNGMEQMTVENVTTTLPPTIKS